MYEEQTADERVYVVLVNDEEQYSLWPRSLDVPDGWRSIEFMGTKEACMNHVDQIWTDMRPKSLREKMESGT